MTAELKDIKTMLAELALAQSRTQQQIDSNIQSTEANRAANAELRRTVEANRAASVELRRTAEANHAANEELRRTAEANRAANEELRRTVEANSAANEELRQSIAQTQQQIDSNARAVEANSAANADLRQSIADGFAETRQEIQQLADDMMTGISSVAEDTDRQPARLNQSILEHHQRFETLLAEARKDRKWLKAAQENIQTLFSEITRIWQRLSA